MIEKLDEHTLRRGMWRIVDAGLGDIESIEHRWPIERFFEAMSYLNAKMHEQQRAMKEATARMGG